MTDEELLAYYAPEAKKIAGGFARKCPRHVQVEDLMAAAMEGLWGAIRRKGDKYGDDRFRWYLRTRVRGAILDELRRQDWSSRWARAHGVAPTIVYESDSVAPWLFIAANQEDHLLGSENAHDLTRFRAMVSELEPRDQLIVRRVIAGVKLREIGSELGISEPRVSQLMSAIVLHLKRRVEGTYSKPEPRRRASPRNKRPAKEPG